MQDAAGVPWHENASWSGRQAMNGYQKQRSYEPYPNGHLADRPPPTSEYYVRSNSYNNDVVTNRCGAPAVSSAHCESDIDWKAEGFLLTSKRPGYRCTLCDVQFSELSECQVHVRSDLRHAERRRYGTCSLAMDDELVANIPSLTAAHRDALNSLFTSVLQYHALDTNAIRRRMGMVDEITRIAQSSIDTSLRFSIYGSLSANLTTRSSDVNVLITSARRRATPTNGVRLNVEADESSGELEAYEVRAVLNGLQRSIRDFYGIRVKRTELDDREGTLRMVLAVDDARGAEESVAFVFTTSWRSGRAAQRTAALLRRYVALDDRVGPLCMLLTEIARLMKVPALRGHVCALLVVYFLQRTEPPVLPILGERVFEPDSLVEFRELDEAIGVTSSDDGEVEEADSEAVEWRSMNRLSVADLLIDCLHYWAFVFDPSRFIVSIRQRNPLERLTALPNVPFIVQDPAAPRRNLTSSVNNPRLFYHLRKQFIAALRYFSVPQTRDGPLFSKLKLANDSIITSEVPRRRGKLTRLLDLETLRIALDELRMHLDDRPSWSTASSSPALASSGVSVSCSSYEPPATTSRDLTMAIRLRRLLSTASASASSSSSSISDPSAARVSPFDQIARCAFRLADTALKRDYESGSVAADLSPFEVHLCFVLTLSSLLFDSDSILQTTQIDAILDNLASKRYVSKSVTLHGVPDSVLLFNRSVAQTVIRMRCELLESRRACDVSASPFTQLAIIMFDPAHRRLIEVVESALREARVLMQTVGSGESCPSLQVVDCEEPGYYNSRRLAELTIDQLAFHFDSSIFSDSTQPVSCALCDDDGHSRGECPYEASLEVAAPSSATTTTTATISEPFAHLLSNVLGRVQFDFAPRDDEIRNRELVLRDLLNALRVRFRDAELHLFGSATNGLPFGNSDLQISVILGPPPLDVDTEAPSIPFIAARLREAAAAIARFGTFCDLHIVNNAVKVTHAPTSRRMSVFIENRIALMRSTLIRHYVELDARVRPLGYALQLLVKMCKIGDVAGNTLSSYAYLLMLVHYLQQKETPVLPVLHEAFEDRSRHSRIVHGCQCAYQTDRAYIDATFERKNCETLGELWIGFLRYFSEQFAFRDRVVSIRQRSALTKRAKRWTNPCLSIEDPIDVRRDLGALLTVKTSRQILRTFQNALKRFSIELFQPPAGFQTLNDFFFHPGKLTPADEPLLSGSVNGKARGSNSQSHPPTTSEIERQDSYSRPAEAAAPSAYGYNYASPPNPACYNGFGGPAAPAPPPPQPPPPPAPSSTLRPTTGSSHFYVPPGSIALAASCNQSSSASAARQLDDMYNGSGSAAGPSRLDMSAGSDASWHSPGNSQSQSAFRPISNGNGYRSGDSTCAPRASDSAWDNSPPAGRQSDMMQRSVNRTMSVAGPPMLDRDHLSRQRSQIDATPSVVRRPPSPRRQTSYADSPPRSFNPASSWRKTRDRPFSTDVSSAFVRTSNTFADSEDGMLDESPTSAVSSQLQGLALAQQLQARGLSQISVTEQSSNPSVAAALSPIGQSNSSAVSALLGLGSSVQSGRTAILLQQTDSARQNGGQSLILSNAGAQNGGQSVILSSAQNGGQQVILSNAGAQGGGQPMILSNAGAQNGGQPVILSNAGAQNGGQFIISNAGGQNGGQVVISNAGAHNGGQQVILSGNGTQNGSQLILSNPNAQNASSSGTNLWQVVTNDANGQQQLVLLQSANVPQQRAASIPLGQHGVTLLQGAADQATRAGNTVVLNVVQPLDIGGQQAVVPFPIQSMPLQTGLQTQQIPSGGLRIIEQSGASQMQVLPLNVGMQMQPNVTAVQNVALPVSIPQGSIPVSMQQGSIPLSIPQGSFPVSIPQGGIPVAMQQTGIPIAMSQGGMPVPLSLQSGSVAVSVQPGGVFHLPTAAAGTSYEVRCDANGTEFVQVANDVALYHAAAGSTSTIAQPQFQQPGAGAQQMFTLTETPHVDLQSNVRVNQNQSQLQLQHQHQPAAPPPQQPAGNTNSAWPTLSSLSPLASNTGTEAWMHSAANNGATGEFNQTYAYPAYHG